MDETISFENLKIAAEELKGKFKEAFDQLAISATGSMNPVIKISDVLKITGKEGADALQKIVEKTQELFSSFLNLTEMGSNVKSTIVDVGSSIVSAFRESDIGISNLAIGLLDITGTIDKSVTGMGKLGDAGYETGSKLTTAFKSIEPIMKGALGDSAAMKFTTAVIEGTDRVIGLQRELISMSVAQGRANSLFDETTHTLKNLDESYQSYIDLSYAAAVATGQTVGAAMDLTKALSSIPGALADVGDTVNISRIAIAAGREQDEVAKQAGDMYTRLGTNIKDATEAIAYMQDKGGDSKLRMESFNQTVMAIAGSFKMLGDNTIATTNFVKSFDLAFQDSKISPEAMKEVIASIGEGVQRMDVAKKAFVSGATGGPGGLAGAIQMDYAIQTGHADEVIRKTMLAMQQQFGGQVVTLKDAAENQSLAGEFYKQIQYLTQVAGIAKDEDQAKRILEAMKSGVTDILKPGAGETDKEISLSRQLDKGSIIQEQTKTTLMSVYQSAEKARLNQDKFYSTFFSKTDATIGKIAEAMGVMIEDREDKPSGIGLRAFSEGRSGEPGTSFYTSPEGGMRTDQMAETAKHLRSAIGTLFGDYKWDMLPEKSSITPLPNIEYKTVPTQPNISRSGPNAGISELPSGHLPQVNPIKLPDIQLPENKGTKEENQFSNAPQKVDVNVELSMNKNDDFMKFIRAEVAAGVEKDIKAKNRTHLIGR
jgi:hypothetical protein